MDQQFNLLTDDYIYAIGLEGTGARSYMQSDRIQETVGNTARFLLLKNFFKQLVCIGV